MFFPLALIILNYFFNGKKKRTVGLNNPQFVFPPYPQVDLHAMYYIFNLYILAIFSELKILGMIHVIDIKMLNSNLTIDFNYFSLENEKNIIMLRNFKPKDTNFFFFKKHRS